jgi:hypothetical protein
MGCNSLVHRAPISSRRAFARTGETLHIVCLQFIKDETPDIGIELPPNDNDNFLMRRTSIVIACGTVMDFNVGIRLPPVRSVLPEREEI